MYIKILKTYPIIGIFISFSSLTDAGISLPNPFKKKADTNYSEKKTMLTQELKNDPKRISISMNEAYHLQQSYWKTQEMYQVDEGMMRSPPSKRYYPVWRMNNENDVTEHLQKLRVYAMRGGKKHEHFKSDLFYASITGFGPVHGGGVFFEKSKKNPGEIGYMPTIITVAFRGTSYEADLFADGFGLKVSMSAIDLPGKAHAGFYYRYLQGRQNMMQTLASYLYHHNIHPKDAHIIVTGHSLGAALATIAAADIKHNFLPKADVSLHTFASPRCVDEKAANAIEHMLDGKTYRVFRQNDPVPMMVLGTKIGLGLFTGFKHVGYKVLKLESGTKKLNWRNHVSTINLNELSKIEAENGSLSQLKGKNAEGFRTKMKKFFSQVPKKIPLFNAPISSKNKGS
jgi:hypothetical protein